VGYSNPDGTLKVDGSEIASIKVPNRSKK